MKTPSHPRWFAVVLLFAGNAAGLLFGQGPLTPPGPPAPTMKTLTQVEPRTDVTKLSGDSSNLYIISQPGSYYLTGNIVVVSGVNKKGISIQASGVTVDLNGFAVIGPLFTTLNGIDVPAAQTSVAIRNGTVTGWNFGVNASTVTNGTFEQLRLDTNTTGLSAGTDSLVKDCVCDNRGDGIDTGGGCTVINCTVYANFGTGISTGAACIVSNCSAKNNGINGISTGPGCTVTNCNTNTNSGDGIQFSARCLVTGNSSNNNGNDGINATGGGNRIDSNSVWNNTNAGIEPAGTNQGNVIVKNSAGGNNNGSNNYALASGNEDYGPFGKPGTATNPLTNFQ